MNFDHILLRLKQELGIPTDKEVAELLGLSKTAFAERKRRNVFPEDRLFSLVAQQPNLSIDAYYVLTGERLPPEQGGAQFQHSAMIQGKLGQEGADKLAEGMIQHAEKRNNRKSKTGELIKILDGLNEDDFDLIMQIAERSRKANILDSHLKNTRK